jgi:glycosyltransferase involved in cell wall biosynthesis
MSAAAAPLDGRQIQLLAWDNAVGLGRDLRLIEQVLAGAGAQVTVTRFASGHARAPLDAARLRLRRLRARVGGHVPHWRFDANLMLERLRPYYFGLARRNLFMPNPEWFSLRTARHLSRLDRVLCKTEHACALFAERGCGTDLVGFTADDCHRPGVPRQRAFFHLAGRSRTKGTEALLALWRAHPHWPRLTVVQHPDTAGTPVVAGNIEHIVDYLPEPRLRELQNAHRFHLCPSQAEGFGHYLCEAMSVGAVVLTLDAPPMNELVGAGRGLLVPAVPLHAQGLVTLAGFSAEAMAAAIERALALDDAQLDALGAGARAWFEANDAAFRQRLPAAVAASLADP